MKLAELIAGTEFENLAVDYKTSLDKSKPISWVKSLIAFANCGGGIIALGVENDGTVIGIPYAAVDFAKNLVNENIDRMVKPGIFRHAFKPILVDDGTYVLLIEIKDSMQVTYAKEGDYREIVYVRHDGQSVPATVEEMAELFRTKSMRRFDEEPSQIEFSQNDFLAFNEKATAEKRTRIKLDENLGKSLGLVAEDLHLTQCGVLFSDSCNSQNANIHLRRWAGVSKGSSQVIDDKEFIGSLLFLYDRAKAFIQSNVQSGYTKLYSGHEPVVHYPPSALHEALVNALAHRDYLIDGCQIDVDIYQNRIEIGVPGSFLVKGMSTSGKLSRMYSERRNKAICSVFDYLGMMERSGEGFQNIIDSYVSSPDDKKPVYQAFPEYFVLTLFDLAFFDPSQQKTRLVAHVEYSRLSGGVREYDDAVLAACYDSPKSTHELLALTPYKSRISLMNNVIIPLMEANLLLPTSHGRSPSNKYRTNTELVKVVQ